MTGRIDRLDQGDCSPLSHTTTQASDPSKRTGLRKAFRLMSHRRKGMAGWRVRLFRLLLEKEASATEYLHIPPDHVVEVDMNVEP